ncbi:tetratricopeptide repeat protein [Chthonomonas calidirosea]|uniref:tetratricopeptide repeat protein n=1 Tax=Chthonomonas calidirosea TaxID=454171 RepID=UPI0006EC494F|nr:hypothetical protein [Chthonomonas calidirosea]CEK17391.1 hypothetical protein CP488_01836 [Chthonomonas calidirosea]
MQFFTRWFQTGICYQAPIVCRKPTLLLILQTSLMLVCFDAPTAFAGHYVVSYSGGQIVTTTVRDNNQQIKITPMQTALNSTPSNDNGIPLPGYKAEMSYFSSKAGFSISSELDGPLTATFTWVPDRHEPPPAYAIVRRRFYLTGFVNWNTQPLKLTMDSGLGLPLKIKMQRPKNAIYEIGGANCLLIAHPASHFSVSISPKVVLPSVRTDLEGGGFIHIVFQAFVTPIQMKLEGWPETPDGTEFMVGQGIKASITADDLTPQNLQWKIDGDCHPFKAWDINFASAYHPVARYIPLERKDLTAKELHFYPRTPSRHNQVVCTCDIPLPPDSLPKGGFHHLTITSSDFVVLHPVITTPFSAWVLHDAANNTTTVLDNTGVLGTYGIFFVYGLDGPVPFSQPESGVFPSLSICQIIQPKRRYILANHLISPVPGPDKALDDQILFPNGTLLPMAIGLPYPFFDAPSIAPPPNASNIAEIEVNDTFHDYLLFQPLGGCPIPIQEITWQWQAHAVRHNNRWSLLPHSRLSWRISPYYPQLPQWSQRVTRQSLYDVCFPITRSEFGSLIGALNHLQNFGLDLVRVGQGADDNGDLAIALQLYQNALAHLNALDFQTELQNDMSFQFALGGSLPDTKLLYSVLAQKDQVVQGISEALRRLVAAEIYLKMGQIQLERGKAADALQSLKESQQLEPQNPMVSLYLSLAYYRLEHVQQARDSFAQYAEKSGRAFTTTDYDTPQKLGGLILLSLAAEGNWGLLGPAGDRRRAAAYEAEATALLPNASLPPYRD